MSRKKIVAEVKQPDVIQKAEFKDVIDHAFTKYAFKVIEDRAIPDARDGLKPSQRRILYAMDQLGLAPNKKHMKCAKIVGECFVAGTLINTSKGLSPIEDVEIGDMVYTQKGLRRVTQAYVMPKKPILQIELHDGRQIQCTEDQKFKILDPELKYIWKKASELTNKDFVVCQSTFGFAEKSSDDKDVNINENIAYMLGFFLADGWITRDKKRGYDRLSFSACDLAIIEKIKFIIKNEFGIDCKIHTRKNNNKNYKIMHVLRINNNQLNKKLIDMYNLKNKYAHNIEVPACIFTAKQSIIYAFVSGFIDGDGSIHHERNAVNMTCISKIFMQQMQLILLNLKIHSKLYKYDMDIKNSYLNQKGIEHRYDIYALEINSASARLLQNNLRLFSVSKSQRVDSHQNKIIYVEKTDVIPYLGQKLIAEFSRKHLGGGWYLDDKNQKIRCGLKYANGRKIRYSRNLATNFRASPHSLVSQNVLAKMQVIGSEYLSFTKHIVESEREIFFTQVKSITKIKSQITYDIQVEDLHEFIANGMVVHNCMGNYHPHGDVSLYGTLVGMAQPWSMRLPLVDPQGNFGSLDGDAAAAQRYTEAKLSFGGSALLEDLSPRTVKYKKNYDESRDEPTVLPGKLPNLLANGGSGIAVGYATNIPPHNLRELATVCEAYIKNNDITADEILKLMPGPDFPTGGKLLGQDTVLEYYRNGRSTLKLEGVYEVTSDARGNDSITITQFPEGGSPEKFRSEVKELIEKNKLGGISDIANFTSNKIGIKVVVEVGRNGNVKVILNQLLSHTCLRATYSVNNTVLIDGKLHDKAPISTLIKAFVDHREEVLTNKYRAELSDCNDRIEILDGLINVATRIDDAIKTIRGSESADIAAQNLLAKKIVITEKQAKAVLAITLAKLTKLEQNALTEERNKKRDRVSYLTNLLANRNEILQLIIKEQHELAQTLGNERRTAISGQVQVINEADLITQEDVVVCITADDCIKRVPLKDYRKQNRGGVGVISGNTSDELNMQHMFSASTHDDLLCFTDSGRAFSIKVYELPEAGRSARGKPIVNFINLRENEHICAYLPVKALGKQHLFVNFISKHGFIKKTALRFYSKIDRSGVVAVKIKPNDKIVSVIATHGIDDIMIATHEGKCIRFSETEIRMSARGSQGVCAMDIENDFVVSGMAIPMHFDKDGDLCTKNPNLTIFTYTNNGYGKRTEADEYLVSPTDGGKPFQQSPGGKGRIDIRLEKRNAKTAGALVVGDDKDIVIITKQGQLVRIAAKSVSIFGRGTSGVRLLKLSENDEIIAASAVNQSIDN